MNPTSAPIDDHNAASAPLPEGVASWTDPRSPYYVPPQNRAQRRSPRNKAQAQPHARVGLSAREMFVGRVADQNTALRQIKLTAPQRRALGDVDAGRPVSDAMFAKLEVLGLVEVDLTRSNRSRLTGLGQAYIRRGQTFIGGYSKGGKR